MLATVKRRNFGPTQKDIAKALNLSPATVAYALNPKYQHKLLAETVALIQAKADEIDYRPQRFAGILRNGRSHTIAVIFVSGVHYAPQERVKLLAQSAIKAGYRLVAMDLDWFALDERAAQDYLLDSAAEGVIFCNINAEENPGWLDFFRERSLPFVSLSSSVVGSINQTQADMQTAYREMTEHHLRLGSRRLTLLLPYRDADHVGPWGISVLQRARGFTAAIRAAGGGVITEEMPPSLVLNDNSRSGPSRSRTSSIVGEIIYPVKTDAFSNTFELGYYQASRLLHSDMLPESLVCSNDEMAAGALSACLEKGIAVPETVRISGADNTPFSRYCGLPLTTIQQPLGEMTKWSIERIVELIETPAKHAKPQSKTFACNLLLRRSTDSSQLQSENISKSEANT